MTFRTGAGLGIGAFGTAGVFAAAVVRGSDVALADGAALVVAMAGLGDGGLGVAEGLAVGALEGTAANDAGPGPSSEGFGGGILIAAKVVVAAMAMAVPIVSS
jgi:hypothetical protein